MKHYKNFGETAPSERPRQQQMNQQMMANGYNQTTSISDIPMMDHDMRGQPAPYPPQHQLRSPPNGGGGYPDPAPMGSKAIRNLQRTMNPSNQSSAQSEMMMIQPSQLYQQPPSQPYPQQQFGIPTFAPQGGMMGGDDLCFMAEKHIKKCGDCRRKMKNTQSDNFYITIIIILVLIIMFLVTKVIDKSA
jgi:hypothetical protein